MHRKILILFLSSFAFCLAAFSQTNMISTNAVAEQIMLGNYDPTVYTATQVINHPDSVSSGITARVSPDSIRSYLEVLRSFQTRNTGSDTVSSVKGIGAARRWVHGMLERFGTQNENRLITSYLQFDQTICNIDQHKNIFALLPGTDTSLHELVLIEGHLDTRCADLCDTSCLAEGMEDNGSGTALVMELARVMSKYSFKHTIVFLLTIAEEQGLAGAEAFAVYAQTKGIGIKAVLNNDVVGGILCGQTSSAPSCPGVNNIDSTHVRIFSSGGFNSANKQLARYIKLEYKEMLLSKVAVPMGIHIMTPEDHTGRGGDHIPFRQKGYSAIRVTSANEHGDADVSVPGYADRQHTSSDILGVDTNNDQILDSFFVDFNYLARNTVINGNAAGMIAMSPKTPDFTTSINGASLTVNITQQQQYQTYRLAVRQISGNDWDTVYTFSGLSHTVVLPNGIHAVSVASVDNLQVESLFSRELVAGIVNGIANVDPKTSQIELLQNKPNPFDEATHIGVMVNEVPNYKLAYVSITDVSSGKEIKRFSVELKKGLNEIMYEHGYHAAGTFLYTLYIDGKAIQSKKMQFIN